jgi:hypothetical protein
MTSGLAVVATSGIRLIREESVLRAFTSGHQPSAFRALAGRFMRIGMRGDATGAARPGMVRTNAPPFRAIFDSMKRLLPFRSSLRLRRSRLSY